VRACVCVRPSASDVLWLSCTGRKQIHSWTRHPQPQDSSFCQ